MGETIRKSAAREDIFQDVQATHIHATARGGVAATFAEERLSPVLKIITNVKAQRQATLAILAPLEATLDVLDTRADKAIGKVSDDIWNDIGRPATDAGFDLMFPGGNGFYVDGEVTEQPDRMDLLVELLNANVHPKVSAEMSKASIAILTTESAALRVAVDAVRPVRSKLQLLERILTAVTKSAAIELAQLKRLLKASGFSEADVHTIIPDRSGPSKKEPTPTPVTPAPT